MYPCINPAVCGVRMHHDTTVAPACRARRRPAAAMPAVPVRPTLPSLIAVSREHVGDGLTQWRFPLRGGYAPVPIATVDLARGADVYEVVVALDGRAEIRACARWDSDGDIPLLTLGMPAQDASIPRAFEVRARTAPRSGLVERVKHLLDDDNWEACELGDCTDGSLWPQARGLAVAPSVETAADAARAVRMAKAYAHVRDAESRRAAVSIMAGADASAADEYRRLSSELDLLVPASVLAG